MYIYTNDEGKPENTLLEKNVCGRNFSSSALSQIFCISKRKTFAIVQD